MIGYSLRFVGITNSIVVINLLIVDFRKFLSFHMGLYRAHKIHIKEVGHGQDRNTGLWITD